MQAQDHHHETISISISYTEFTQLLSNFLRTPLPEIQKCLTSIPYQMHLQVICNREQHSQIRLAACTCLPSVVAQRQKFLPHWQKALSHIEQIYFQETRDDPLLVKIQSILQLSISKILQTYLDDQKKMNLYIAAMDRIGAHLSKCNTNLRIINLLKLFIRSMHYLSINNEILIGQLVIFMKNTFMQQPPLNQDIWIAKGNGLQIIKLLLGQQHNPRVPGNEIITTFTKVISGIISLMQQIVQIVNMDNQQQDNIPGQYLKNSSYFKPILNAILSIGGGCIITNCKPINALKSTILEFHTDVFPYYADQTMLDICFSTLWQHRRKDLCDQGEDIMLAVVVILSRSAHNHDYWKIFHAGMHSSTVKIVEIVTARESEISLIQTDPEQFIERAQDFCLQQQEESLKVRAGALVADMAIAIDGFVPYLYNFLSVPLLNIQRSCYQAYNMEFRSQLLPADDITKTIKKLLQLTECTIQEFTQSSILILSSISDQFDDKRPAFKDAFVSHCIRMLPIFKNIQQATKLMSPLLICRYIQFFSYYPFENCLDVFLPYYPVKKVYACALVKALQTIIRVHDRKDRDMRSYVSKLSQNLILMSSTLTPLMEEMIMNKSHVMICVRDRVLQKLVGWMLDVYTKRQIVGCNKLSNLIIHLIRQYQSQSNQSQSSSNPSPYFEPVDYNSMMIWQYLYPLYKCLDGEKQHPAEQCLVEIVVAHVEYLIAAGQLGDKGIIFYKLGVNVVERNGGVLNSCIQLFGKLIRNGTNIDVAAKLIISLGEWEKEDKREEDLWQIIHLTQICIITLGRQHLQASMLNMHIPFLMQYIQKSSKLLNLKIIMLFLSILSIFPSQQVPFFQILNQTYPPVNIPIYQIRPMVVYYCRVVNLFIKQDFRWFIVSFISNCIQKLQNKKLTKKYEEDLYGSCEQNQAQINAYHKSKQVYHPLSQTDVYQQFRQMINTIPNKDNISHLPADLQLKIKNIYLQHRIEGNTRKVLKVKR